MDVVHGCGECRRLADAYESETMAWFRVEGQMRIAEYAHDEKSACRIALDLDRITRRRSDLRLKIEGHKSACHAGEGRPHPGVMMA
jgi:hypothetical protein